MSRTRRRSRRSAAAQHRDPALSALLENQAGFYGSQMTAMDNATRNAGDMINRLSIQIPEPPGGNHDRTHRNHLGRRSALTELKARKTDGHRRPETKPRKESRAEGGCRRNQGSGSDEQPHRPRCPGHRRRRRRRLRGRPSADPHRARDRQPRQPPGPRGRAAPRRERRPHDRHGLDRRPDPRPDGRSTGSQIRVPVGPRRSAAS